MNEQPCCPCLEAKRLRAEVAALRRQIEAVEAEQAWADRQAEIHERRGRLIAEKLGGVVHNCVPEGCSECRPGVQVTTPEDKR